MKAFLPKTGIFTAIFLIANLFFVSSVFGQTTTLYLQNTATQPGTTTSGLPVKDLSSSLGSPNTIPSQGTTSTSFVETLAFTITNSNPLLMISGTSTLFDVSVNVSAVSSGSLSARFRLQRVNSSGGVESSTSYSGTFNTTGTKTATLSFSPTQTWNDGDRLRLSIEVLRTSFFASRFITVSTGNTSSFVRYFCISPTAYDVTGGGGYCIGEAGPSLGLSNSQTGVSYQLNRDGNAVGLPVTGTTGSAISFGPQTVAGTYTVVGSTTIGGCTTNMTGNAIVSVNPLPQVSDFIGNSLCESGIGQLTITENTSTTGPFTVVYNDGSVNGVISGVPFSPVTNPTSTTNYSLVSVTDANGCVRSSGFTDDAATIKIDVPPTATAGGSQTICSNDTATVSGATASVGGVVTWSHDGYGSITVGADPLTPTYDAHLDDAGNTVTLTMTVTSTCPSNPPYDTATYTIIVVNASTVDAGPDQIVCATSPAPEVSLAGGDIGGSAYKGTWSGSSGITQDDAYTNPDSYKTATYTPTPAEILAGGDITLTLTSIAESQSSSCYAAKTDTMVIHLYLPPMADAGSDQEICAGSTVPLAGVISGTDVIPVGWTSSGTGVFDDVESLAAIYTPSPADITNGTVTLTLTTNDPEGPCTFATDFMVVTINTPATATASSNLTTTCGGQTITLTGSSISPGVMSTNHWSSNAGGAFGVSGSDITFTPAIDSSSPVILTLTSDDPVGPCPAATSTLTINVNSGPAITSVTASPPAICIGNSSNLVVTAPVSAPATIVNYNFNTGTSYSTPGTALTPILATDITSVISSSNIGFATVTPGTTGGAYTNNTTAGNALNNTNPPNNGTWVFTIAGSSLKKYSNFKLYFQAQRATGGNNTVVASFSKDGGTSTNIGTVSLTNSGTWVVGDFTLVTGANNPNSTLVISLVMADGGNGDIKIDNFQVQAVSQDTYSWTATPSGVAAGLPVNSELSLATNSNITVSPTVTTDYVVSTTGSNGCTSTDNVTVTVNPLPVVTCPTYAPVCKDTAPFSLTGSSVNGVFDVGGTYSGPGVSSNIFNPAEAGLGANIITYTYVDGNGCSNSCNFTIVVDDSPPVVITQNITISLSDLGIASIAAADVNNGSSDNCGIQSMSVSPNTFNCTNLGSNIVTLTVTDTNGNIGTESATVTVEDKTAPVINGMPIDKTVILAMNTCAKQVGWTKPTASDACGAVIPISDNADFEEFGSTSLSAGVHVITYTATDASGNSSTASFTITVKDTISPTITGCPVVAPVNTITGTCSARVFYLAPTASDNCTGVAWDPINNNYLSGNIFPVGTTPVIYTARDASGNTATCTINITVNDIEKPTIATLEGISVNADSGVCTYASSQLTAPTAADNCSVASVVASPSSLVLGANTVTWTATDGSGNTETSTQIVTVIDDQDPTIDTLADASVNADPGVCTYESSQLTAPAAADNCSLASVVASPASLALGANTVTWTATDASGNTQTSTQIVTVIDDQDPTIDPLADTSVDADSGVCTYASSQLTAPTAADNCSVESVVASPTSLALGANTVTWTATDASGNTETSTQIVTVIDDQDPTIDTLADTSVNADPGVCTYESSQLTAPTAADN
jgi:hypothetical protein